LHILSKILPTDTNVLSANLLLRRYYGLHMRKTLILSLLFALALPQNSYAASKSITGELGQTLTTSATMVANNAIITVTGKRFDESIGLYLAICVIPKKGLAPTPCGGGVNNSGNICSRRAISCTGYSQCASQSSWWATH